MPLMARLLLQRREQKTEGIGSFTGDDAEKEELLIPISRSLAGQTVFLVRGDQVDGLEVGKEGLNVEVLK